MNNSPKISEGSVCFELGDKNFSCPVELALSVIGGKWKALILNQLIQNECRRFGELRRGLPAVTDKMLTQQLREMEADGIVHRKVYAVVPPKVEYSLTDLGRELIPVVDSMKDWGLKYMKKG